MNTPIWNGPDKPITYLRNYKDRGYFSLPEDREHKQPETLGETIKSVLGIAGFLILLILLGTILD